MNKKQILFVLKVLLATLKYVITAALLCSITFFLNDLVFHSTNLITFIYFMIGLISGNKIVRYFLIEKAKLNETKPEQNIEE